jgi:hypothetical protein
MPSITNIIRKAAGKLIRGQTVAVAGAAGASAAVPPKPVQVAQQGKKEGGQDA